MTLDQDTAWWRGAVCYQIYPRSFQDSNGDGIGDLEGIIARLDYLNDGTDASLGIDAIWLSPTFPSPMKDFGYDVSDYEGVAPEFGDIATMDRLIAACHARGIRVLLDLVPCHSSDQHPWFIESRSSRTSAKRDWYYWRDPKAGEPGELPTPPNNWRAVFGGPAWEFDATTGQYYLHSFLVEQPDLNWRNPEVVAAMHGVLRFWFERGVDGFRIDALGMLLKHPEMPDNPENTKWKPGDRDANRVIWRWNRDWPDLFEAVAGMRAVFDEYPGTMAVGEVFGRPETLARYIGTPEAPGLHLAFNFQFIGADGAHTPWDAGAFRAIVQAYTPAIPEGGYPCYAFGNHDRSRFISRHNADGRGAERAHAAALLLLGLRGAPFLYYGEEIGMADTAIPEARLRDPSRFLWEGRDPERTPMQWDASAQRGFSTGEPWLPFGPAAINVASQLSDRNSLLALYRRAIQARKREPALHAGDETVIGDDPDVFVVMRRHPAGLGIVVAVNTATAPKALPMSVIGGEVLLCSDRRLEGVRIRGAFALPALGAVWIAL